MNGQYDQDNDPHDRQRNRSRSRGPGRAGPLGPGSRRGFGRGPAGGTRSRARRGAVGRSILVLLAERPMHGYEMIAALDERTGHAWKPSAGSMYPALDRLADKGLIEPVVDGDGDKQRYRLTKVGQRHVAELAEAGVTAPWTEGAGTGSGDLRSAAAEMEASLRQIGRFGSRDQVAAAKVILADATAQLSQLLPDGADPEGGGDTTATE